MSHECYEKREWPRGSPHNNMNIWNFPLLPESASTFAAHIDLILEFLLAITVFFSVAIGLAIIYFAVKYRHTREIDRVHSGKSMLWIEITWTVVPLIIVLFVFVWSSGVFYWTRKAPENALPMFVVAKQWMFKTQNLEGVREINSLHVPLNQPIRLSLISEDVIHGFSIPAFRVKQDILPGRYNMTWFQATKVGTYHLFCTAYCGDQHSRMVGTVTVMEPKDYEEWLAGGKSSAVTASEAGEQLFNKYGCITCHKANPGEGRCPTLHGLYGNSVKLVGGRTVIADEAYIRESILNPQAKIVAGYEPVMPSYQGQINEEGLLELLAYIKTLKVK